MSLFKLSTSLLLAALLSVSAPLAHADEPPLHAYYQVGGNDTLWSIAAKPEVFGDPYLWPLLFDANRDRITDPDVLEKGWDLYVPLDFTYEDAVQTKDLAYQYMENGNAAPALDGPAVAGPDIFDEVPAQEPAPAPHVDLLGWAVGLGIVLLLAGSFLGLSLLPMFFVRWDPFEEDRKLPRDLDLDPLPAPTDSEAYLRALEGPDPERWDHAA